MLQGGQRVLVTRPLFPHQGPALMLFSGAEADGGAMSTTSCRDIMSNLHCVECFPVIDVLIKGYIVLDTIALRSTVPDNISLFYQPLRL